MNQDKRNSYKIITNYYWFVLWLLYLPNSNNLESNIWYNIKFYRLKNKLRNKNNKLNQYINKPRKNGEKSVKKIIYNRKNTYYDYNSYYNFIWNKLF